MPSAKNRNTPEKGIFIVNYGNVRLVFRLLEGINRLRLRRDPNLYLSRLEKRVCLLIGQA